ncbi:MAG: phosphatase PAP2 family protein [Candidatus Altiarchaeota archaeon]
MDVKRLNYYADKIPELPYFLVALLFVLADAKVEYIHVFSTAFIFLSLALAIGVCLKLLLKTRRPKPYKSRYEIFRYGFPSLHTMISIGALAFVYYIDPLLSLVLAPVGVFYIYARISGGFHTRGDVLGGMIVGVVIGAFSGSLIDELFLPGRVEFLFAFLFFAVPTLTSVARIKEIV